MAKNRKETTTPKPEPEVVAEPEATGKPPGVVVTGKTHGLQEPSTTAAGIARLRLALNVSDEVEIERLCETAAAEIEHLRGRFAPKSMFG